jgi:hypothetical protein
MRTSVSAIVIASLTLLSDKSEIAMRSSCTPRANCEVAPAEPFMSQTSQTPLAPPSMSARLTLLALEASSSGDSNGPIRGYVFEPDSQVVQNSDALHRLTEFPKPLVCYGHRRDDILHMSCEPIGSEDRRNQFQAQLRMLTTGKGLVGELVKDAGKKRSRLIEVVGAGSRIRVPVSELGAWRAEILIVSPYQMELTGGGFLARFGGVYAFLKISASPVIATWQQHVS